MARKMDDARSRQTHYGRARHRRSLSMLLTCAALATGACEEKSETTDADGSVDGSVDGGTDGGGVPIPRASLCNGTDEVRLSYREIQRRPSGNPGFDALPSLGLSMLLLDGKCRVFASRDMADPVVYLDLDEPAYASLHEQLMLASWSSWRGTYCRRSFDVPVSSFDLPGQSFDIVNQDSSGCSELSPALNELDTAAHKAIVELLKQGKALEGPVRYVLVPARAESGDERFAGAQPWPLGEPTPSLSTEIARSRVVMGSEASALRALRAREPSNRGSAFVPVQQGDGTRYELYMRDVLPYEDEQGRLIEAR